MELTDLIGNTRLVELKHISNNPKVVLYGKMEGDNPGGSVKDRAAYSMIKGAMDRGDIKKGDTLIEATSGNTGIALAMVARIMGLKMTLVMPDNSTRERVLTMEAYGAEVILTPSDRTIEYSRELAEDMAAKHGYYILNQFANPDNYLAHFKTTGPEILRDTNGTITHFVSAMGTTGTIMGVSRYLKSQNKDIQIIGTQPTDGSSIPGIRRWSPEFLPKIFERDRVDRVIDISESEARSMTQRMAREEGILAGMSSGGALTAALKISGEIEKGVIVFIICDRGDRYLSSDLFTK